MQGKAHLTVEGRLNGDKRIGCPLKVFTYAAVLLAAGKHHEGHNKHSYYADQDCVDPSLRKREHPRIRLLQPNR